MKIEQNVRDLCFSLSSQSKQVLLRGTVENGLYDRVAIHCRDFNVFLTKLKPIIPSGREREGSKLYGSIPSQVVPFSKEKRVKIRRNDTVKSLKATKTEMRR